MVFKQLFAFLKHAVPLQSAQWQQHNYNDVSVATISIMTGSITTVSIMTPRRTTFNFIALSIRTLSKKHLTFCHSPTSIKCDTPFNTCSTDYRNLAVMLSVIVPNVVASSSLPQEKFRNFYWRDKTELMSVDSDQTLSYSYSRFCIREIKTKLQWHLKRGFRAGGVKRYCKILTFWHQLVGNPR